MKFVFSEILDAYEFVSSNTQDENAAHISLDTGEILWQSDAVDELPEDFEESDRYVPIPHRNELDLGNQLVFDFAAERLPEQLREVERIFDKRGAYSRFKELLTSHGLLDAWYAYENERTEKALKEWCAERNIEFE